MPMKMEQAECSETSAYKIQTPGNNPEESIKHNISVRFVYAKTYHHHHVPEGLGMFKQKLF